MCRACFTVNVCLACITETVCFMTTVYQPHVVDCSVQRACNKTPDAASLRLELKQNQSGAR